MLLFAPGCNGAIRFLISNYTTTRCSPSAASAKSASKTLSSSTHGKLMVRKSDAAKETDRDKSDDDPKLALSGQKRLA
jgi:hypothetical protein